MSHPALAEYPAPWRFGKYGIVAANGKMICEIFGRDPGPAEDLMIAAPELYDFIATLENDDEKIPAWLWEKRNTLLAKARGENPT